MNRLRLYAIKLITEVNPHFFKTIDGQESFRQSISWLNATIKDMRLELVEAAAQARVYVHVDKFPRHFALPQRLSPRMMNQLFTDHLGQFFEFEQFYTVNMYRINRILTAANQTRSADSMRQENCNIEAFEAVHQNTHLVVDMMHAQIDQFEKAVSDIQKHAKIRYHLIASYNKPFNSRLTHIYELIIAFKATSGFEPHWNDNNADDLANLEKISAKARQVIEQIQPKRNVKASDTPFDCLAKLVEEFNDLCNAEEQKYSPAMYDVPDPAASGFKAVKVKLTQLAELHDEFNSLAQAKPESNLHDMNSTLLAANMARLILDICSALNGQHQIGLPIFKNAEDLKLCVQFAKNGFYHALLTQDLAKIQRFVHWFVRDLTEPVDNRYFQGRRFQPITTEQIPHEYQQVITSNWTPEEIKTCRVQLDNLNYRVASLVLKYDELENNQASDQEKSELAVAQVFCLAKAGLLVRSIALSQGQCRMLPREYSYSTQQFIGIYNPTQSGRFFAACSSRRTTPLLTYLERTYFEPGGKEHCVILIDQMTKMDLEIALQEFVNLEENLPSSHWSKMSPHVRALVNQIARNYYFAHNELDASFTNNLAQASLFLSLPGEASQAFSDLTSILPTFEIGHFDELNAQFIEYIHRVLWDLSQGQFRRLLVDVFSALGNQSERMIGFINRYAVTPEQILVMDNVNRILSNLVNWRVLTDDPAPEFRQQYP